MTAWAFCGGLKVAWWDRVRLCMTNGGEFAGYDGGHDDRSYSFLDNSGAGGFPTGQQQMQQQPQMQQPQQQQTVPTAFSTPIQTAQSDADRQALLFSMQERMSQQQQQELWQPPETGWISKAWQRRKDVTKLVVMSMVILLALSSHSVLFHYFKTYIEESGLSRWREFAARAIYPVGVLLIIWAIKAAQPVPNPHRAA